jgi:ubiquinone biosynthesis protein
MPFPGIRQRLRKLKRYRQILSRLAFYGFGEAAEALGLRRWRLGRKPAVDRDRGGRLRHLTFGTRLRLLLEGLGPTFIKLGQLMSLRSDLLPEEVTSELEKLQYGAAPLPFSQLEPVLRQELGPAWRELFRSVDPEPIASASIAQVHRAVARDGEQLVLKIQRPGIADTIRADMAILLDLAAVLERYLPRVRVYRPTRLIDHFAKVLTLELDFLYEGRTMDLFRENFQGDPTIHIPTVRRDLSTQRLLAMEYIAGVRLSDPERFAEVSMDTKRIARVGATYVLAQVFRYGVYNADPHPANFIVTSDGVLAPVDFGMVSSLSRELRHALVTLLLGFVNKDPGRLVRLFASLGLVEDSVDREELGDDLGRLIDYYRMPIARLPVSRMMQDLSAVIRKHRINLPADLALTLKVIVTLESLGRRLDPDFDILEVAGPFVARVRAGRLREWLGREEIYDLVEETGRFVRSLPWQANELLEKARTGRLRLKMDFEGLDQRVQEIDRSINRLAFSVVIAGVLVGSSLVIRTGLGPSYLGLPVLGLLGFAVAGILGIWFLIGTLRSGRL